MPYRPLATADFRGGVRRWSKADIREAAEVAPDPEGWLTALRFDVDAADAGTRWMDAGLPPPNLIIRRRSNGHAHLVYLLRTWVRTDGLRGWKEVRFATAVDRAYTAALHADTSYAGRFQHNPLSAEWDVREGRAEPYSLGELAQFVDLHAPPAKAGPTSSGIGRNVETFDRLRRWAYREADAFAGRRRDDWDAVVAERAMLIAADVRASHPGASHAYRDSEVRATARSVAGWTWDRRIVGMTPALAQARAIALAERARQRAKERRSVRGAVTRSAYVARAQERRVRASEMRGLGWSLRAIARALSCSASEISRLLKTLMPAAQGSSRYQTLVPVVPEASRRGEEQPCPIQKSGPDAKPRNTRPTAIGTEGAGARVEGRIARRRLVAVWLARWLSQDARGSP